MNTPIIFRDGWRVFFMAAGIYAVLSMLVWLVWLGVQAKGGTISGMPFAPAPHIWHAHEMIFGFATAALGGFLLTAIPGWTGTPAMSARFVTMVAGLWLAGRVAVWFSGSLPAALVAVIDLAFVPILAARFLGLQLRQPRPQNLLPLGLLVLVSVSNLLVHLDWMGWTSTEPQGLRGGLLTICAMIAVIGGRVTPAFTRNALLRSGPRAALPVSRRLLDMAGVALAILTALLALLAADHRLTGIAAVAAGLAAGARLAGWRTRDVLGDPIVWALHAGYALLALGLVMWGLANVLTIGSEVGALHVLGIGAVGGMTLAVMSRASIGHSGRVLRAPGPVALAYLLMPLASGLRWMASTWPGTLYHTALLGAGVLWTFAFALYVVALWPVWTTPRRQTKEAPA